MDKIAVCVPTAHAFKRLTRNFLPSYVEHIDRPMRNSHVEYKLFLLCQGYSAHEERVIRELTRGFNINLIFVPQYSGPISMSSIRNDVHGVGAAYSDYLLWGDCDFKFQKRSMERYNLALKYLQQHPQCAGVQLDGHLGGYHQKDAFKLKFEGIMETSRGLLMRIKGIPEAPFILPMDCLGMPGGHEDGFACWGSYKLGYYIVKLKNCPTVHMHVTPWSKAKLRNDVDDFILPDPNDPNEQGIGGVPFAINPKNPVHFQHGVNYLSKMLGTTFVVSNKFYPDKSFWDDYVTAAEKRFGSCEGEEIRNQLVEVV